MREIKREGGGEIAEYPVVGDAECTHLPGESMLGH